MIDDIGGSVQKLFTEIRERVWREFVAHGSGRQASQSYGQALREALATHWEQVCTPSECEGVALAVTGGVGRGDCVFGSDLDCIILVRDVAPVESSITDFIQHVRDQGLEFAPVVRTLEELEDQMLRGDVRSQTALLEMCYCAGDDTVWTEARREVTRVAKRGAWRRQFVHAKRDEQTRRRERCGGTPFFLEPNVKSSEGGLRDWHTLCWIGQALGEIPDAQAMTTHALLAPQQRAALDTAIDTLLCIRWTLHKLAQRSQDRLGFAEQEKIIAEFQTMDAAMITNADALMQAYYQSAATIRDLSNWLVEAWLDPVPQWKARWARWRGRSWFAHRGTAVLAQPATTIETAIQHVHDAAQGGLPLHSSSRYALRRLAGQSPEVTKQHAAIRHALSNAPSFWRFVHELHRTHLLDRIFPEFAPLHYRAQRDAYHCLTIDVHLLHALRNCAELLDGPVEPGADQQAIERARAALGTDRAALLLATVFHDIGKGTDRPHEERGAEMVTELGERLDLPSAHTARAAFLVRSHQLMPAIAFGRDIHEPQLIEKFAEIVETQARLAALYVLSIADLRAVGPAVYSTWKATLLAELYMRTANYLESGDSEASSVDREVRITALQGMSTLDPEQLEVWIRSMPDRYLVHMPNAQIVAHMDWWYREPRPTCGVMVDVQSDGAWTIDVVTQDRSGTFAACCAVLTAHGCNIVEARAFTGREGNVVDRFRCAVPAHMQRETLQAELLRDVSAVLSGQRSAEQLYRSRSSGLLKRKRRVSKAPVVRCDNGVAEDRTVIDVHATDRPGLLYELSHCLAAQGLDIMSAKILTVGDRVRDAFYVRSAEGRISDPARLAQIEQALYAVVEEACQ